jgi:Na+-driven multidrug efflux pump
MVIVSYYFVGLPLGGYLMLGTGLKSFGFWIGIMVALVLLVVMQTIYIVRIDWKKIALQVSASCSRKYL